jgi:hypothetical protein
VKGEKERTLAEIIVICWSAGAVRKAHYFGSLGEKKKRFEFHFRRIFACRHISKARTGNKLDPWNAKDAICNVENIHLGICILKDKRPHAAFSPSSLGALRVIMIITRGG